MFEICNRVPMVVRVPGKTIPGSSSQGLIELVDLYPTLLDLTGTPRPAGVTFDGESLAELLMGEGGSRRAPLFFRRPPDRGSFYGEKNLPDLAVRDGDWKLLCDYDGSNPQLYDLANDRSETTNVATDHPAEVEEVVREKS